MAEKSIVHNNNYGDGVVTKNEDGKIYVDFKSGQRYYHIRMLLKKDGLYKSFYGEDHMYYLYRFLNEENVIIYIGKTKQLLRYRFRQHAHLPESCYSKVYRIEYLECRTEADMTLKEVYYINKYRAQGMAEYNVADVSTVPRDVLFEENNDNWKPYMGSLPGSFSHSINYINNYKEEEKRQVIRNDGRIVRFHQNSKEGQEKFVYPFTALDFEKILSLLVSKMKEARSNLYCFYNFRTIVIFALGVSMPIKGKDLVSLKIKDIYNENGEIKPIIIHRKGEEYSLTFPNRVKWLLSVYYRIIKDKFEKDDDYWMFWGQKDDGEHLKNDALAKTITKMSNELMIKGNYSVESLRKSYLKYIFDIADNKYEAIECVEFLASDDYRHRPAKILKYLDIIDHNKVFNPAEYMKEKYLINGISNKCFRSIKESMCLLN